MPSATPTAGVPSLVGRVYGGQQPVGGAAVHMLVPGSSGYGSATSVLATATTASDGTFALPSYTCPANSGLVYLVAIGGNAGSGSNSALALSAVLGPCSLLTPSTDVVVNEVSTVAAAYVLSPFASVTASGTRIGTSATNLQGLTNAFGPVGNLVNPKDGSARPASSIPGLVIPQAEVNTLADILAGCVNSNGSTAPATSCGRLFSASTPTGGVAPIDTFQAALNIALHPGANVAALFSLSTTAGPFQPGLGSAPNDFTLGLQYTGGGIAGSYGTQGIAIDGAGNAWVATGSRGTNQGSTHQLTEISPNGSFLSGSAGFGSSSLTAPYGVAIGPTGNVYVTDIYAGNIRIFSQNGSLADTWAAVPSMGIAVDIDNSVWITDAGVSQVSHLTANGAQAPGSPFGTTYNGTNIVLNSAGNWSAEFGFGGNGSIAHFRNTLPQLGEVSFPVAGAPAGLALDASGDLWYTASTANAGTIGRLNAASGANLTTATLPSPLHPQDIFLDGLQNVWVDTYNGATNSSPGALLEYTSTGTLLSPASGYAANGSLPPFPGIPNSLVGDSSGNLWLTGSIVDNSGVAQPAATVTELLGIAAPVTTPTTLAAKAGTLAARP